jgi:hypothetical protein
MGHCSGVDYDLTLLRVDTNIYYLPWATLCHSRLYPAVRNSGQITYSDLPMQGMTSSPGWISWEKVLAASPESSVYLHDLLETMVNKLGV